jgi:hypothetical protein
MKNDSPKSKLLTSYARRRPARPIKEFCHHSGLFRGELLLRE